LIIVPNGNICASATHTVTEYFYIVQWENSNIVCIIPQASIFKSADFTHVNDICIIEVEGKYRKGQIKYRGKLYRLITILEEENFLLIFRIT
jgi:hypothetical protein